MTRASVHQAVLPTLWGFATLTRRSHPALSGGGGTRRVDTVLPPVLTPDELGDFHDELPHRSRRRRRLVSVTTSVTLRRALRGAIDLRTTAALCTAPTEPMRTPTELALGALVRAMRAASGADLAVSDQALARQLVWCALTAAHDHRVGQVLDSVRALRHLTATAVDGAPADRIDHG